MGSLLKLLGNVVVVAGLGWLGWYGYTNWVSPSSEQDGSDVAPTFNCRQALARLAEDYACRESAACDMTPEELTAMQEREAAIEQHCN